MLSLFIQNYAHLLNIIANEPSLGMYRIQEHIRKTLPKLDQQCSTLEATNEKFKDLLYGVEQSTHAIKSIDAVFLGQTHFDTTNCKIIWYTPPSYKRTGDQFWSRAGRATNFGEKNWTGENFF